MTTFDKREEGFEKMFAHDEELKFKANARRNKLLGLWAAEKLGMSGVEADAYAKAVTLIGAPGAGQLTKMMNQMCIAGIVQGLAEAINLGQKAGVDMDKAIGAISKGAAQSWQMENRYKTMAAGKFDFGFAVDWVRKDRGIGLSESRRNGAHLPVTALVDQFYSEVQKMGGKRWDTSSLIALLDR